MTAFRQDSRSGQIETFDQALQRAGFYPALISDVVDEALDGRACLAHVVHLETHFDRNEVQRHVTVLALAEDILVIAHVDDQCLDDSGSQMTAQISTESVAVAHIRSAVLSYVYAQPQDYRPSDRVRELTLSLGWSGGQRIDLSPASCGDPYCEAEHGFTGSVTQEDISLRVSAEADGPQAVEEARRFVRILRELNGRSVTRPEPAPFTGGVSFSSRLSRNHYR